MMAISYSIVVCGILMINHNCIVRLHCTGKPAVIKPITRVCQSALETPVILKRVFQLPNTTIFPRDQKKPQQRSSYALVQPQTTYQQEDSAGAVWLVLGKALFWPWRSWPPAAVGMTWCWVVQSAHRGSLQVLSSRCHWVSVQQCKLSLLSWARQHVYCQKEVSSIQKLTQQRTTLNQSYLFSQPTVNFCEVTDIQNTSKHRV